MQNWEFLIDESALASVLPDEYAHYRRPIAGALGVFLNGLPEAHQEAILVEQASLPQTATVSERLTLLARNCPALHKLGQILARDRRLSLELRQLLQQLESLPPSIPLEMIQSILAHELGPLDRLGVTLMPPALAEASVAVVIPFRNVRPGRSREPRHGVFKILKPGIEQRLEMELELLEHVGSYLDQGCDEFRIPHLDYRESFEQVRDKLRYEIRLDLEQHHLSLARAFFGREPGVQIPALFEHCTRRVTAMERVRGEKVTEHALDSGREQRKLAELVVRSLIARPIFSKASDALFHSDPHAGNLFFTTDHRLAILDWSLVGSLGELERSALIQIILGAMTLNTKRIITTLTELDKRDRIDLPALESVVNASIRKIEQGQFPGLTWLMAMLDEAFKTTRLRFGSDLLLFRKTLHMIEGVVADIGAGDNLIDRVVLREFLCHLTGEWPRRWLSLPYSRAFATRLSNTDLAELVLGLPWTAARFWLDRSLDLLSAACPA